MQTHAAFSKRPLGATAMVNCVAHTRRQHLAALAAFSLFAPAILRAGERAEPFSFDRLIDRARTLARQPWRAPEAKDGTHTIDYDALNRIAYRADAGALGGKVRFFPLSRTAPVPVRINLVTDGMAIPFRPDATLFETDDPALRQMLDQLEGFAGFRVMNPGGIGDWLAFQGASYFRAAGALDQYGLSARGIAIDTAVPGRIEEFPRFTEFWITEGPDGQVIVHALLDSPSLTGAFRFACSLGSRGVAQDVSVVLFARKDIAQLGLAPLTSMYWYGASDRTGAADWRPEIHDSDGLAIHTGAGERIWRPLRNPPRLATSSFLDRTPRGFGLLQRDRNFEHYQDDGVFYERRPSLWVTPTGDWGKGAVTLYEIPTSGEIHDNIVAFWVSERPMRAGETRRFAYRLDWIAEEPAPVPPARVIAHWEGVAGRPGEAPLPRARKLVADFEGTVLRGRTRGNVMPELSVTTGRVLSVNAYPVVGQPQRWRLMADIEQPDADTTDDTADVRAFLRAGNETLSETLVHQMHWTR